jgi:hypothetical protein
MFTAALLAASATASAQQVQRLEQEKVLKYGKVLSDLVLRLGDLPIKHTPDIERGMGLRSEDNAGLIIPDKMLTAEAIAALDATPGKIIPAGVLYAHKMTMAVTDENLPIEKLRTVAVTGENNEMVQVVVLPLAVAKVGGRAVLLVYTKENKPAVVTTLEEIDARSELPIELEAKAVTDTRATLLLKVLGRYKAAISVAPLP